MKKKTEEEVAEALRQSQMVEPVSSDRTWSGWAFLCRLLPGQEKNWLKTVENILRWASKRDHTELFIARQYLLKNDKVVFGWFVELKVKNAKELKEASDGFCALLKRSEKVEVPKRKPSANSPRLTVVSSSKDSKGNVVEEVTMPLPNMSGKDMNVPSKPIWNENLGRFVGGQKGAKGIS